MTDEEIVASATEPPTDEELARWKDTALDTDGYLDITDDLRMIAEIRRLRAQVAEVKAARDALWSAVQRHLEARRLYVKAMLYDTDPGELEIASREQAAAEAALKAMMIDGGAR